MHADALNRLAAEATAAVGTDDSAARVAWRQALRLLPPGSVQYQQVAARLEALGGQPGVASATVPVASGATGQGGRGRAKWAAGLGVVGAALVKFKWAILFLLGKGKLLLLGLTKAKTLLTMALSMVVYTTIFGWRFAVGFIASIYVHEMGHVAALRSYGIAATAPMFVPGFGAFVRLKENPAGPVESARVGLAGPIWGAVTAVVCFVCGRAFGWPIFLALARAGAWINLFNLLPLGSLDGGRGFGALSRRQRLYAASVLWLAAISGGDGLLFVLAIVATARGFGKDAPERGDAIAFATYVALVIGLTALVALVPMPSAAAR